MANRVYTSIIYALVRLAIWSLSLAIACFDGFRHRHVRSQGWQLFYMLLASVGLFVLRNITFLAICIQGSNDGWTRKGSYGGYIFFSDVAESYFIFLLLAISAGLCITRTSLGPHKTVCIVIPVIFFITSLVVDYVLFSQAGLQAFDYKSQASSSAVPDPTSPNYDPEADPLASISANTGFLFFFCTLANTMAFFMAWFYIYDTARAEWQALQSAGAETGGLPPVDTTAGDGTQGSGNNRTGAGAGPGMPSGIVHQSEGVGHSHIPTNAALLEEGENASHLYGDIVAEDLDAPKTVQDRLADRDKARLMKQFFVAVSLYIMMSFVVFFVPLFVPAAVDAVLLMLYDALLWLFLAGLLVVFRQRQTNQFLLLGDEGGAIETTTELGVLYHDDDEDDPSYNRGGGSGAHLSRNQGYRGGSSAAGHPGGAPAAVGSFAGASEKSPAPRFTLEDDDAEGAVNGKPGGGEFPRRSSNEVNASAAAQGVVVRPLGTDG